MDDYHSETRASLKTFHQNTDIRPGILGHGCIAGVGHDIPVDSDWCYILHRRGEVLYVAYGSTGGQVNICGLRRVDTLSDIHFANVSRYQT